jgi:hypothetical protein
VAVPDEWDGASLEGMTCGPRLANGNPSLVFEVLR